MLLLLLAATAVDFQDGDDLGSLNGFREGDDPQEHSSLKNADKFEEVESGLTFVGICGIKVSSYRIMTLLKDAVLRCA